MWTRTPFKLMEDHRLAGSLPLTSRGAMDRPPGNYVAALFVTSSLFVFGEIGVFVSCALSTKFSWLRVMKENASYRRLRQVVQTRRRSAKVTQGPDSPSRSGTDLSSAIGVV